jgi:uncharacterized protein DUF5995
MQARNIDEVVQILDGIIADCTARADPLGYFPTLYRAVTLRVKAGIAGGAFQDGPRMDAFDAAFANRYFAAYEAFQAGGAPSKCWKVAFETTRSGRLIILQDLVVGINAHINFDLGVAAADMFGAASLGAFHEDFNKINAILAALTPQAEEVVGRFSPLLHVLATIGGKPAIEALGFSMLLARDDAWMHANLLAMTPAPARPPAERALDDKAAFLGRVVGQPPWPVSSAVDVVRETESHDVAAVIAGLSTIT